jgi:hypothetical protein
VLVHAGVDGEYLGVWTCVRLNQLSSPICRTDNDVRYFHSWFHCMDAFVIVAGFILDIILRGPAEEAASLIVILRLWRVFKIIEELSVGAQEQVSDMDKRINELELEVVELRRRVARQSPTAK